MSMRILYTLCLTALALVAQAQRFTSFVDRNKVAVGETFQVSFRLENIETRNITYPDFSGFQVMSGPNTTSSMQIVNGQVSRQLTYSFFLTPKQNGTLTIGPASAEVNGQTLRTDPIQIEVSAAGTQASPDQPDGADADAALEKQLKDLVFVRTLPDKRSVWQGEQVTVNYKFFKRVETMNLTAEEPPRYEGFWVENVEINRPTAQNEVLQGVQYQTALIKQDLLFPQRSGELSLDPMTLSCVVRVQTQPQRPRTIFDNPFFNPYREYKYSFKTPAVSLTVKPLPAAGRPADFSGAVGTYTLVSSIDKTETETGEPVTLRITVSGQGNIKKLPTLKLDFPPDFEVYDPVVSEQSSRDGGRLGGRRTYEYLVLPRNPGTFTLPVASFSYFDIAKEQYKTLRSDAFSLTVTGEPQAMTNPTNLPNVGKDDIELIGQDIRYIRSGEPRLQRRGASLATNVGYYTLYGLPVAIFVLLLVLRRRQIQAATDVAGTRSKLAAKMARKHLTRAQQLLAQNDGKGFYKEVSQALWGYLAGKFNLGTSELSRARVGELLAARQVDPAYTARLGSLLDTCEMALYAPNAVPGGMQGTYDEVLDLITRIESSLS
ncbi:MAG: BatD family protein [Bacteroidia bacterium]